MANADTIPMHMSGPGLAVNALRSHRIGPVSFDLRPGECVAVMGASGAGKTLLLRLLADLDPGEGSVSLDGVERDSMSPPDWRRQVMLVSAVAGWWAATAGEHFTDATRADVAALCRELRLPDDIMGRAVAHLSTGEKQRLALVRAIVERPDILLLDEPTSGLDREAASAVETCLKGLLGKGTGILLVTHDAGQASRMATRIYLLKDGSLQPG
ncbi:ATP-binding cassette domain-containing protein [Luteibacter aegosomatis]|uniref:ABC transporter ATP-binding protein n=1 Tax=Luteibacter aegosomatis TaxID=2911537 RepID=UPI001FF746C5|nr:ATP-binding cassette domain-containing protein [Luteibacter aegosomatis]UPG83906.1 ATP-binding cassette domain-containing protein [Luteibacter aegosomatis]